MKIAILTSKNQWFEKYALEIADSINAQVYNNTNDINDIKKSSDITLVVNYFKPIKETNNMFIIEPQVFYGKGWSPIFWLFNPKRIFCVNLKDIYGNTILSKSVSVQETEKIKEQLAHAYTNLIIEFIKNKSGSDELYSKQEMGTIFSINKEDFNFENDLYKNRYTMEFKFYDSVCEAIDFVDMDYEEKIMVLSWRNNDSVRKWMYNTDIISLNEHLDFIEGLFLSKDKQYLLIKGNYNYIGVINITKIDLINKSCELGIYANPVHKMKGVGSLLQEILIKYVFNILHFNKLTLEVFADNERAMHLYQKFGFKETCKKTINNKTVACMEINNENR